MKILTLEDYQKAGETFWPKYWYIAKELGEDVKPEQSLKLWKRWWCRIEDSSRRKTMHHLDLTRRKMTETQQKRKAKLSDSFGGTVEKDIPADAEWIDEAFYIKKTRFGLYTSILKGPLGQHFITGATYEGVLTMSRWHLKCLQEGTR